MHPPIAMNFFFIASLSRKAHAGLGALPARELMLSGPYTRDCHSPARGRLTKEPIGQTDKPKLISRPIGSKVLLTTYCSDVQPMFPTVSLATCVMRGSGYIVTRFFMIF